MTRTGTRIRLALAACLIVTAAALAGGGTAGSQEAGAFLTSVERVSQKSGPDSSQRKEAFARCPDGAVVIGGGAEIDGGGEIVLRTSSPAGSRGWRAAAFAAGDGGGAWSLIARATCARDDGAEVTAGPAGPEGPVGLKGEDGEDLGACQCQGGGGN